jgi:putative lipoprotein (rSAM/lipoprotein system)
MKKSFIKFFDKIIVLLLGFSGAFNSCVPFVIDDPVAEYGMPHADFEIKGTVTNQINEEPIPNIRVIREIYPGVGDTLYTDSKGKYDFVFSDFPNEKSTFKLKVEDIDGDENGGLFIAQEMDVEITKADQVEKGNGHWYSGKFSKIQDIKLQEDLPVPLYGVFPASFKP